MWILQPPEKGYFFIASKPLVKTEILSSPIFENMVGGSIPPPNRKGADLYVPTLHLAWIWLFVRACRMIFILQICLKGFVPCHAWDIFKSHEGNYIIENAKSVCKHKIENHNYLEIILKSQF